MLFVAAHRAARTRSALTLDRVDPVTKRTESGNDYLTINPKGYVPALELDDGEVLTEGPAITQYLVDRYALGTLAPLSGTIERAWINSYLTYISTELHKPFGRLFDPALTPDARASTIAYLHRRFALAQRQTILSAKRLPPLGPAIADGPLA